MAIGYRLWFRLHADDDVVRSLTATVALRRMVARRVLKQGTSRGLLAFRACGLDLRLLVVTDRPTAKELARRTKLSILRGLSRSCTFGPTKIDAISEQWHLQSAFCAVLRHGDPADPGHEASNLPDLLGLRLVGRYTARNVRSTLPRINRERLLELFGHDVTVEVCLDDLAGAAAAAICQETLTGKASDRVAARAALIEVVGNRLIGQHLARQMNVDERTVKRLRGRKTDADLVRAIQLQMGARRRTGGAGQAVLVQA